MNNKILVETHCHTLISHHAHSTIDENLKAVKENHMQGLCITNHGPGIPDGAHEWHFLTLRHIPKQVDGIAFFSGIEANIIDYNGTLCVGNDILAKLDFVIASIHTPCLDYGTVEQITQTYVKALQNPFVHCLGHIGQKAYMCDFEEVVKTVKSLDKIIEINNHSLNGVRPGADVLCREVALLCKKYESKIVVSSDAHYCGSIGHYENALTMLDSINFPDELIINTSLKKFENYLIGNC